MSKKEESQRVVADHRHHPHYGTFHGVTSYPPPPLPPPGFPQPGLPSAAGEPSAPPLASFPNPPQQYAYAYQAIPDFAVAQGRPLRARPLPCCGIGVGWLLFLVGFFLAGVPWYAAAVVLLCSGLDHREKPGYIACSVAAIILTILILVLATSDLDDWFSFMEAFHG